MEDKITRRAFLRVASLAGMGVAGASLLAACAPKPAPTAAPAKAAPTTAAQPPAKTEPTKAPAAAQPAAKPGVTVVLNMRAGGEQSEAPMYVTRVGEFSQATGVKVELGPIAGGEYFVKVQTMASSGTLGDVMWTSDVWTEHSRYVKLGMIAQVDDFLDANKYSKKEWLPACVDTLTYNGKMYGLPKCCHPSFGWIFYNKEMFEKAGLKVPEGQIPTPDSIFEWAKKLAQGSKTDRTVYGYYFPTTNVLGHLQGGRTFGTFENNAEGTKSLYDTKEWLDWAKWQQSFFKEGLAVLYGQLPSSGIAGMFAAGKLAMFNAARSDWKACKLAIDGAATKFTLAHTIDCRTSQAKGWPAGVDTHSATKSSKNLNEALMLSYAMADKRFAELVAKEIGYLTGRVDDIDTIKPFTTPWLELQYQAQTMEDKMMQPANARGREVETILNNNFDLLWLGKAEADAAFMKNIKTQVDEVLAKPF